jgi:hypothetical protein
VDQGQQRAAGPVRASPLAQVDHLVHGLLDAQPLGQGGRQRQAGVGDGVGVVEAGVELVQVWEDAIEHVPSRCGEHGGCRRRHASRSGGLSQPRDQQHSMTATVGAGDDPRRWW